MIINKLRPFKINIEKPDDKLVHVTSTFFFLFFFFSLSLSFLAEIVTLESIFIETEMVETETECETTDDKEIVSYQRYGRTDTLISQNSFKCHLCGFSCRYRDSLLKHFREVHPN